MFKKFNLNQFLISVLVALLAAFGLDVRQQNLTVKEMQELLEQAKQEQQATTLADFADRALAPGKCLYEVEVLWGKSIGAATGYTDTYAQTHLVQANAYSEQVIKDQVKPYRDGYEFAGITYSKRLHCLSPPKKEDIDTPVQ